MLSCSGFLITYANCPIVWGSKMQSLVALSTMEMELIDLLTAQNEVIHLQNLLQELHSRYLPIPFIKSQIICKTFEDNAVCIKVAKADSKIFPCTKHLSACLFHFCNHVECSLIKIQHVPSKEQQADIFTKPLPNPQFNDTTKLLVGESIHLSTMRECELFYDANPLVCIYIYGS